MTKKSVESLSFEQALEKLETIIEEMEGGETPLAELVAKFEEGSRLLKACQSKLNEAELKIEKLNLDTGTTEAFEDDPSDA
ncbi:exodeoxyribonuclease VII small subunit [Coraliomargarita parva]|uniref:exodeoxyribonuclease VII small subunit n=1 Tax=Coraliomargarita parva TaxID=3014050 RepID=UPI0022B2B222|nr:exodeoxyribonuclease VII small subunit [Coraliomargarita parva]